MKLLPMYVNVDDEMAIDSSELQHHINLSSIEISDGDEILIAVSELQPPMNSV